MNDEIEQAFRQGYIEGHKQGKEEALEPKGIKVLAEHYGFTSQANMLVEESAEFNHLEMRINYCPLCGRELRGDNDA